MINIEFVYFSLALNLCSFSACYFLMRENNKVRDADIDFFKTRLHSLEHNIEEIMSSLDYIKNKIL